MLTDFKYIANDLVTIIESAGHLFGYIIAWPEADVYFIDNIAIDPARRGSSKLTARS